MNEYEVIIEEANPCGGSKFMRREVIEVEAESPLAYVEANRRLPITEISTNERGETVIITSNHGYAVRYTFSEC